MSKQEFKKNKSCGPAHNAKNKPDIFKEILRNTHSFSTDSEVNPDKPTKDVLSVEAF